jgi:hypothetical protein
MNSALSLIRIALVAAAVTTCAQVLAQTATPPLGYFDIPQGFDFPADKQTLEQFRTTGNVSAQRKHVWNVFAGMTQPTPDNKFAIFETWYSEDETFDTGPAPQAIGPRRVIKRFREPQQFRGMPGQAAPEAAGSALLSEVMFNFANHNHVRTKKLNSPAELQNLIQTGAKDPQIQNNTTVPPFPPESISLKTVWWPVAKDKPTPMPIWDPEANSANPTGAHHYSTWKRIVVVDPTRTNIPPNETTTINFHGPKPNSHVVGLDKFHYVVVDAQIAANVNGNGRLQEFIQDVFSDTSIFGNNRTLQEGDYLVFSGTHLTTKEIDDWVWATFWWHDQPDQGPFAADRTDNVKGVWRNYLMSASYDLNLPKEGDGTPHISFNPWLEAHFASGVLSNCMNCHHRAALPPPPSFLPIFRGNPDPGDPAYGPNKVRTDFLWSIVFRNLQ